MVDHTFCPQGHRSANFVHCPIEVGLPNQRENEGRQHTSWLDLQVMANETAAALRFERNGPSKAGNQSLRSSAGNLEPTTFNPLYGSLAPLRHQKAGQQSAGGGGVDVKFARGSRRVLPRGKTNSLGEAPDVIEREPNPLWLCGDAPSVVTSDWVQQRLPRRSSGRVPPYRTRIGHMEYPASIEADAPKPSFTLIAPAAANQVGGANGAFTCSMIGAVPACSCWFASAASIRRCARPY